MSRRGAVASIVSFVLSFASVGCADAPDPSAHCSLMWPVVQREFSPERSWQLRGEAFSFSRTGDGPPEFQVLCFESVIDSGTAVIIAEWGDPDRPELGPLVY